MTSSLSLLPASFLSPSRNQKSKSLVFSLLSPPRHRSTRRNHLRPKLPPKHQTLETIPLENPNPAIPIEERQLAIELEVEELEGSVQEVIHEFQSVETLTNPNTSTSSLVLDISFRFAALLAVQTAAAVYLFGGVGGLKREDVRHEERTNFEATVVEGESTTEEKGKEPSDFDRVVLEIREMAKEARESEAKEREENEAEYERFLKGNLNDNEPISEKLGPMKRLGFAKSNVARESEVKGREENEAEHERVLKGDLNAKEAGSEKLGPMKRLGFVKSNVARRKNVGKGFNGAKKIDEGGNARDNGGVQQIAHRNLVEDSLNPPEPRQSTPGLSKLTDESADVDASLVLPYEKFPYVGSMQPSRGAVEGPKNNNRTSLLNHKSTGRRVKVKQSIKEGERPSSTELSGMNGKSNSRLKSKKGIHHSTVSKYNDGIFDQGKRPWWLTLPFVIAILLRRGSDSSCTKGLYSLKMGSSSDDGGLISYTIVFQDQGDATNFCYLLESFFEELDDFSADVVPLTIGELEEGIRSGALKVIVVRKGQLQLYAGQPLVEVETALRCLLD